jgi:hypothetical protein
MPLIKESKSSASPSTITLAEAPTFTNEKENLKLINLINKSNFSNVDFPHIRKYLIDRSNSI